MPGDQRVLAAGVEASFASTSTLAVQCSAAQYGVSAGC